jgi:hypothetical protein
MFNGYFMNDRRVFDCLTLWRLLMQHNAGGGVKEMHDISKIVDSKMNQREKESLPEDKKLPSGKWQQRVAQP